MAEVAQQPPEPLRAAHRPVGDNEHARSIPARAASANASALGSGCRARLRPAAPRDPPRRREGPHPGRAPEIQVPAELRSRAPAAIDELVPGHSLTSVRDAFYHRLRTPASNGTGGKMKPIRICRSAFVLAPPPRSPAWACRGSAERTRNDHPRDHRQRDNPGQSKRRPTAALELELETQANAKAALAQNAERPPPRHRPLFARRVAKDDLRRVRCGPSGTTSGTGHGAPG